MIQTLIILSIVINISISSRRLLQTAANPINPALPQLPNINLPILPFIPNQIPQQLPRYITGAYDQQCLAITPDMLCQQVGQIVSDAGTGTVECSVASSCCACKTVFCGYDIGQPCDSIKVGAANALYGVQQVAIKGEIDGSGAVMDCGARGSCASTYIMGEWVNTMICGGPESCRDSVIEFQQSKGLICGARACIGTTFNFLSNLGGVISCDASEACMNSIINVVGNIQNIKCGGTRGCKDAKITLTDPMQHFQLSCGGRQGCQGLSVDLIITGPAATTAGCLAIAAPDFIEWKGITCGSIGSCAGLTLNVINNGCRPVRIEDFQCIPGQSCTGSNFNFNAGASPYPLALQNCHCGLSCSQATGVDLCFNNIHVLECVNRASCPDQQLNNIANGFMLLCPNPGSCQDLYLRIAILGASRNYIRRIALFDCSGVVSCQGLTVDILNAQLSLTGAPVEVVINAVVCAQQGSCQDATFITGPNVRIENFICAMADSCNNCYIKTDANDPNPAPCNPNPVVVDTVIEPAPVDPVVVEPVPVDPVVVEPAPVDPVVVEPAPAVVSVCIAPYGQCGGIGYNGEICCTQGHECIVGSEYYSQCDPIPTIAPVAVDPIPNPNVAIPDIPSIPSIPSIPTIPTIPIHDVPVDVPQTGGAPAPPQVDTVPVDPIIEPVIPIVQTGGIVIESGNTNTNNPPSLV